MCNMFIIYFVELAARNIILQLPFIARCDLREILKSLLKLNKVKVSHRKYLIYCKLFIHAGITVLLLKSS